MDCFCQKLLVAHQILEGLTESLKQEYQKMMNGQLCGVDTEATLQAQELLQNDMTSMANNRTAKLWLQYMAMVDILKKFIRAERTGNFNLHLEATNDMLPYFAAAGHNSYLKSAQLYLQKMSQLKTEHPDVHHHLKKGLHVVRRSDREWAGLSTDLIIEQVLCAA